MNINKTIIAGLLCAASTSPAFAGNAGTISFTGQLKEISCNIVDGSTGTFQLIDFGTLALSTFRSPGDVSSSQPLTIALENCPTGTDRANIQFTEKTGSFDSTNKVFMNPTAGDGATNIGVQILDGASTALDNTAITDYQYIEWTDEGTKGIMSFTARLYATGVVAMGAEGNVAVPVNFTVSYQ